MILLSKGKTVIGRLLGDLLMQCGVRPGGKESNLEQQRQEAIKQSEETDLDWEKKEVATQRSQLALVEAQIRRAAAQQVCWANRVKSGMLSQPRCCSAGALLQGRQGN